MAEAPSSGGGKIRNKRSTSSRKPYSRAQRRSLFSRVTDSFKSLLNPITPKWLSNRLHHDDNPQPSAGPSEQATATINADSPVASASANHQQHHTNNNYKRSPLCRPPLSTGPTSRTSLQYYITPPDTPSTVESDKPSAGGKEELVKQLTMSSKRLKMSQEPVTSADVSTSRKEMNLLRVEDDASVASSSGCSSSMQASQRSTSVDREGSQRNLWSSSMDSLASSKASSQQTTMTSNKRPRFNPAVFGIPSMGSPRNQDMLKSTFYNGPVQFGGASASVKQPYFATPYKIPSVTKVKVRHVNHQRNPDRSSVSSSRGSKSPLDDSSMGGMSSTARKILQTLETMPSPLNDARRIPSVTRTPSSFLAARQRRRTIGSTSILGSASKGPPIAGLSTPSSVKIRKRVNIPLNNSLINRTAKKVSEEEFSRDTPSSSGYVPDSKVISTRGVPAPLASLSSTASMPKPRPVSYAAMEPSAGGGGKMKSHKRSSAHYSAMHDEEEEITPDLPKVALPLTSSLPSFNFGKSSMTSTPAVRALEKHMPSQPEFNFASPVVRASKAEQTQSSSDTPKFQFSSPPTKKSSTSNEQGTPKAEGTSNFNSGTNQSTPSLVFAPDPKMVSNLRTTKRKASPQPAPAPSETTGGSFRPADNLKAGSVMDILSGGPKKSESMSGKETSKSTLQKDSFKPLMQSKSGWECGVCLVPNDAGTEKCAACGTPKEGTSSGQSSTGANKAWDCEVCLVPNDAGTEKCAACETPRPGSGVSAAPKLAAGLLGGSGFKLPTGSNFSFGIPTKMATASTEQKKTDNAGLKPDTTWGALSKKATGTWDCGVCLVSNDSSADKCEACQTLKPGATPKLKSDGPAMSSQAPKYKFGISTTSSSNAKTSGWGVNPESKSGTWECEVCMVPNSNERKTCEACESPKPGTEKKKQSLNTSFKFGENTSGLFKFGVPDAEPKKVEPEKKVEKTELKMQPKVSFGVPSKDDNKSEPAKTNVPTFNFGAPAAKAPTSNTPAGAEKPAATFSFGAKTELAPKKADSETKPPALFSFGAPKAATEAAKPSFGVSVVSTTGFGVETPASTTSATPPVSQSTTFAGATATSSTTGLPGFKPLFGTTAATSQPGPSAASSFQTKTQSSAGGSGIFSGFNTNSTEPASKPEEPKPDFSFGTSKPSAGAAFQFSGSSSSQQTKPADPTPKVGFTFGASQSTAPAASTSDKPPMFGGFGAAHSSATAKAPDANAAKPAFTGFSFGAGTNKPTAQSSSMSGSMFGSSAAAAPNQSPFGSTNATKQNMFGAPAANQSPFGSASSSSTGNAFGATTAPAFGAPTTTESNSGIPKPSFAFGGATSDDSAQKSTGGFSGFAFGGNAQQNKTATPGGFAFGAAATKPPPAFNSTSAPAFQFGASSSQPQSNGMFQFGTSANQPKNEPANGAKTFVFGGSNPAAPSANQQPASTGFSFGTPANAGFGFSGTQQGTPQGGPMFGEGAPNQNPFSASGSRSTTPVQGVRRIRQARRKLRK